MSRRKPMTWSRAAAWLVSLMTAAMLALVVVFGLFWITTDWSALECFDGNEPGCDDSQTAESGLSAIRASSWIAGALAMAALGAGFRVTWRLRRARQLVLVVALDASVIAIALLLWRRL